MKVAFLHLWTFRLPRGVETLTISLANALASRGIEVTLLSGKRTREPLVRPLPQVRIKEMPAFRYYEATAIVPFYALELIRGQYDVIVTYFADFGEGTALALAAPFIKSRLFLYLTFPYEAAPHRYRAYQRWNWGKKADKIFADASYTAKCGEDFFKRTVHLLPSGTDPERFKPDAVHRVEMRSKLGLIDQDIVLLNVAALERRKGAWRVIEALPSILDKCPDVRYLVLGQGPERDALEARANELGVCQAIIFAGTTADLPPYYNAADIFVMLPDAEAGSVALLEAMASGLPVVVSKTGGFSEVVTPAAGRMVDVHDPAEVVRTLLAVISDSTLRQRMSTAGRERIKSAFAWEAIASQFLGHCCSNTF